MSKNLPNAKFLDNTNFDFANSMVIKPPFEDTKTYNPESEIKYTRVVIDSRDRNLVLYPTPDRYVIDLETDIPEVTSAQVIIKEVPVKSIYLIHKYNNTFQVQVELGPWVTISIGVGNYDNVSALLQAVSLALASSSYLTAYQFVVTVNNAFNFSASREGLQVDWTIAFGNNTSDLPQILGFLPVATPIQSLYGNIQAPFAFNCLPNRYVVLNVDQLTVNNSVNPVLHKSTALISAYEWRNTTDHPVQKTLNPPIARLSKLVISFTDYYGNPVDFQNQDHRLEFLFKSRKHLSRYV